MRRYALLLPAVGIIVGGTFFFVLRANEEAVHSYQQETSATNDARRELLQVREDDLVYGDNEAPLKMVVYSNLNCHFCRLLQKKLMFIVDTYPRFVALIYRPVGFSGEKAVVEQEDTMLYCISRVRDDTTAYAYIAELVKNLPLNQRTQGIPETTIRAAAKAVGVTEADVRECLGDEGVKGLVSTHLQRAKVLEVTTIPHTFLFGNNGPILEVVGNRSVEVFLTLLLHLDPTVRNTLTAGEE